MQVLSLVWGILAVVGMLVGFIPCLGSLNWLVVPFAIVGILVTAVTLGTTENQPKGPSLAGLICCIAAALFSIIRLFLGGGVV
jgi:hypothetical protein